MLIEPGDKVYVNIRFYGHQWYELLNLPKWEFTRYVVQFEYGDWCNDTLGNPLYHRHIDAKCPVFNETWPRLNHNFVSMWGCTKIFDKATMVLVDHQLLAKFPSISEDPKQRNKRAKSTIRAMYCNAIGPSSPLTIITWNVNSLRKRYSHVIGLLAIDKPTILFVQETKLEDLEMTKLSFD